MLLFVSGAEMAGTCPQLVAEVQNVSASEPAEWSYGICPDVEECRLGLHDCHDNATCLNTFDSYDCNCNRGFTGNGRNTCNRTYVLYARANVNHQGPSPLHGQTQWILIFKNLFCQSPHPHLHLLCQNPLYFLPQEVGISLF